jgi:DNA-3-methyladenine glycosylase
MLLGATLRSDVGGARVTVRVTEVEAYEGEDDPASHAFRGPTPRNLVMYGRAGHLYCYFVYGMHWCANVTCGPIGVAAAVLIRAGAVIDGPDVAAERARGTLAPAKLASGPARLARALGLSGAHSGLDLFAADSPVRLELPAAEPSPVTSGPDGDSVAYRSGPRVGVAAGAEHPWRFWLQDEPSVSTYRRRGRRTPGPNRQTDLP